MAIKTFIVGIDYSQEEAGVSRESQWELHEELVNKISHIYRLYSCFNRWIRTAMTLEGKYALDKKDCL